MRNVLIKYVWVFTVYFYFINLCEVFFWGGGRWGVVCWRMQYDGPLHSRNVPSMKSTVINIVGLHFWNRGSCKCTRRRCHIINFFLCIFFIFGSTFICLRVILNAKYNFLLARMFVAWVHERNNILLDIEKDSTIFFYSKSLYVIGDSVTVLQSLRCIDYIHLTTLIVTLINRIIRKLQNKIMWNFLTFCNQSSL